MSVFSHIEFFDHQQVCFFKDTHSGLKAIIAVHSTKLGPALGGCRMWPYANEDDALSDVLRLSKGMTYKTALANLKLGGGKSVIIGDPRKDKSDALLRAMGAFINQLSGQYIAAEDSGISVQDVQIMAKESAHIAGVNNRLDLNGNMKNGDPSPATAYGTFVGLSAAVRHKLGRNSLEGLKVAIQGVGNVGYGLAEHLYQAGAQLFVSDIHKEHLDRAERNLNAKIIHAEEILTLDVDVLAPCALGAVINDQSIPMLKAKIIAGAANNQLHRAEHGEQLKEKGILYAPDFVINAGGVIDIGLDQTGADAATIHQHVTQIGDTLREIFQLSDKENISTSQIANQLAEKKLND